MYNNGGGGGWNWYKPYNIGVHACQDFNIN
jgi:hypothetical protein